MKFVSLTFDVEEWNVPSDYHAVYDSYSCDFSENGLKKILKLLDKKGITATFFITAKFGEEKRRICEKIVKNGHEIASHGLIHSVPTTRKFNFFKKSKRALESLFGCKVIGYRAPKCQIKEEDFVLLKKAGYLYDSSIRPTFIPGRYNNFFKPNKPYDKHGITELPISVFPFFHLPIDWWCMRNIGSWLTKIGASLCLQVNGVFIFSMHPWEVVRLPKVNGVPDYIYKNTGQKALNMLKILVEFLESKTKIVTLKEIYKTIKATSII